MIAAAVGGSADPPRVAFAVGRNVGGAVVRNRVRRRLRAAMHAHADLLRPGVAYLVRAAAPAADAAYRDLAAAVRDALRAHASEVRR